jgi:hypothetical protein
LDATTIGAVLTCVGVLSGSAVAFIGKRGESANSLTDQLQEELASERTERKSAQAEVTTLQKQHRDDLVKITHLEIAIIRLGGTPPP